VKHLEKVDSRYSHSPNAKLWMKTVPSIQIPHSVSAVGLGLTCLRRYILPLGITANGARQRSQRKSEFRKRVESNHNALAKVT
jgi:hypothetical protein